MANLTNLFKFHYLTSAQYTGITTKDAASLYFIKDTGKIYRGTEDFTASVRLVDAFPETSIAQGVLYVNTATGEAKTYNGSAWTTVVRPVDNVVTEYECNIPMMFIQADNDKDTNFSDFPSDILSKSKIEASVNLAKKHIDKIQSDYATLIDVFIENKDIVTGETIENYIGVASEIK